MSAGHCGRPARDSDVAKMTQRPWEGDESCQQYGYDGETPKFSGGEERNHNQAVHRRPAEKQALKVPLERGCQFRSQVFRDSSHGGPGLGLYNLVVSWDS